MPLSEPLPLNDAHELNDFISGVGSLDDWLDSRAALTTYDRFHEPSDNGGRSRVFRAAIPFAPAH